MAVGEGLEVRLLGAVGASRRQVPARLGGDRQRRLLAVLALQPGRTRSVAAIAASLWPDGDLPADPQHTIQTYVSRLRSSLGDVEAITLSDGGYRLNVEETAVDAARFEALLRSANGDGAPTTSRLEILDEALALWAGPALDGYDVEEWARPEAVRLEELRAQAVDDRAQVQLDLGLHEEAVAELRAAVLERPLRERTHRLLMVALQRSGRQAEALRVYQEYRRRLATDLGLEVGDEIRRLEASIATGASGANVDAPGIVRGYRLLEQIGEGAFALVYRARQPTVHRDVALKVLRPAVADQPDFIRRFEAEAQVVARLEHPHVVPIYDFWREPGAAYLAMRLYQGTLEQHLANDETGTQVDAARLVADVGSALSAAHRAGVVHRDIKPANIFVDADGSFFLGDFGIAWDLTSAASGASPSSSVGSLAYASPEQLRRDPAGPRSDIYSLGMVLFEVLSGSRPFSSARTRAELEHRQLHDPLPPVGSTAAPSPIDTVLARATAKDPAQRFASVDGLVAELTAAIEGRPVDTGTTPPTGWRNPYKGLRAFQEPDAEDFFGRQRLVDRMLDLLAGDPPQHRLLAVVGPSGSGKSSVVRAGLLPRLRAGAVPGSERWFVTSMIPGAHPFDQLEVALSRVAIRPTSPPGGDRWQLAPAVAELAPGGDDVVVLVVDQFEELFTLCADDERDAFIASLVEAASDPGVHLRVVVTLRADFYDRPLHDPELATLVEAGLVTVTPLAADELEAAIVEPAIRAGASFEPGLAALVAGEVRGQAGALPLLQYALTELFDRHQAGVLTLAAYREVGGLSGAVARRAETLYCDAASQEQEATRLAFLRLVTLGEGTEDTRRRVRVAELGPATATATVLERYGAARLLTFDHEPQTREPTVELAHESLVQSWPRLRRWLDDDREGLRLHRDLTARAAAWAASGRDEGELYRGARLEAAEQWSTQHPGAANAHEAAFLGASTALHRREVENRLRVLRRTRRGLVAVAVVAVLALVAGGIAWSQQRRAHAAAAEAQRQRDAARAAESAAETGRLAALAPTLAEDDPALAFLLAAEAAHRRGGPETWGALQQALVGGGTTLGFLPADGPLRAVGYDGPDRIVGVSSDQIVVWDATSHQRVLTRPLPVPVHDPHYGGEPYDPISIAGGRVAWVGDDGVAYVIELTEESRPLAMLRDSDSVLLSDNGRSAVVATATGDVRALRLPDLDVLWTAAGDGAHNLREAARAFGLGPPPSLIDSAPVLSGLAVAPDGRTLAVIRTWQLRVFDLVTGELLRSTVLPIGFLDLAFEPAAPHRLVVLGFHSLFAVEVPSLRVVESLDLQSRATFERAVAPLSDGRVALLADGGQVDIVEFGSGPSVEVISTEGFQLAPPAAAPTDPGETMESHIGDGADLVMSPDGSSVVAAGGAGASLLSARGAGLIRRTVPRTGDHVYWVAGRDGAWLVSGSYYSLLPPDQMAAVRSPARIWECPRSSGCTEVAIAPPLDATMEAAGDPGTDTIGVLTNLSEDQALHRFYDGLTLEPLSAPIEPRSRSDVATVLDPESGWVLMLGGVPSSTFQVLDLQDGHVIAEFPIAEELTDVVGTELPSGEAILFSSPSSGSSFLINTTTWTQRPSPFGDGEVAWSVFSGDGKILATAAPGGEVTIRDGKTFEPIRQLTVSDQISPWMTMAFSDDGRFLVTVHPTGGRLWDVATGALIGQVIPTLENTAPSSVPGRHPGLVTASQRWVELWDFDVDQWPAIACHAAGRNMTRAEWDQFGPRDQAYHATCPEWPEAT